MDSTADLRNALGANVALNGGSKKKTPALKKKMSKFRRRAWALVLRAKGFSGSAARKWTRKVYASRKKAGDYSLFEKERAYSLGYMPETVEWLSITKDNCHAFISERDYLYLYPMNGKYDKWLRDRVSAINVFRDHGQMFDPCHFHVLRRTGLPFLISLSPEASEVSATVEGLHAFALARQDVFIASAAWSSAACWKLGASFGEQGERRYCLDDVPFTEAQFELWLQEAARRYVLVVVQKSPQGAFFDRLAPGAGCSVRLRVMNKDGVSPQVAQAIIQVSYPKEVFLSKVSGAFLEDDDEDSELAAGEKDSATDAVGEDEDDGPEKTALPLSAKRKKIKAVKCFAEVDVKTGSFSGLTCGIGRRVIRLDSAIDASVLFKGVVPNWPCIVKKLEDMCKTVPQIEFVEFKLVERERGFAIDGITPFPKYNRVIAFSPEITTFLQMKRDLKAKGFLSFKVRHKRFSHNLSLKVRRIFAEVVAPRGLVPFQSTRWIRDVARDFVSRTGMPVSRKIWAYRHGFLSYRLDQYGITEENWKDFISDFEYRWLRHINVKYKYWLEDKITLKYLASDYRKCFPSYYYFTSSRNGQNRIIPMMDLPEGFGADYDSVLRLARERGVLALKPDEGSHGEGFYKLSWDGQAFRLNGQVATEERVCSLLQDPKNQYLITEYIQMHPQLRKIYPNSVNTVRVTVFKRDGRTPVIGNAYMRIGSSRTGYIDNLAAGGICAAVDIQSGRYGDAKILDGINQGNLVSCPVHPDTGVAIEGVLPNWEDAKRLILGIAAAIPQIEYFGFDVAITEDGIKLPEINRFPDFPRIDKITPELMEYLLYKLECKKHVFGYDQEPCRKLLGLPPR